MAGIVKAENCEMTGSLTALLDEAERLARSMIAEDGDVTPMVLAELPDGERMSLRDEPTAGGIMRAHIDTLKSALRYVVVFEVSNPCREGIILQAYEGEAERAYLIDIERKGDQATLSTAMDISGLR
jgi:hypothetical protein